jgi:hypothetical protein
MRLFVAADAGSRKCQPRNGIEIATHNDNARRLDGQQAMRFQGLQQRQAISLVGFGAGIPEIF